MTDYDPLDWFWVVEGDTSRAWSSAGGAYVTDYSPERLTRIASEAELSDVLRPYGLAGPYLSTDDFKDAIQAHVDTVAKTRNYTDGNSCASYVASTIPQWSAEATAFIAWRDSVWSYAYTQLALVQGGQRPQPSIDQLISELPTIVWESP